MSFWDRVVQAIRYVRYGKAVAALQPSWREEQPEYAIGAKFETLVREGYRKNELIFACLNATAAAASQIKMELVRKRDEQVVEQHPFLDFIRRPNDKMNESDFWAAVVLFQKLAGRAIFEIESSNRGLPLALWPLRPDRIKILQASQRPVIRRYLYTVPGHPDQPLEPEQVVDFPLFDPLDRFKSYPPVAVAGRVGDVDNAATDYIKMIYEHGGVPNLYLKTTQALTDTNIADTRRRWRERYGGYRNWLAPAILDRDQTVERLAWSFAEMGFDYLDARDEVRICMVLDVPPIIVGALAGLERATYSNYELADRAWWRNDLLPLFNNLVDVVEYQLLPHFDPRQELTCRWDVSQVVALQENVDGVWSRATSALQAGGITLNEFYQQIGLTTIGTAGEVRYIPFTTQVVPAKQGAVLPQEGMTGRKAAAHRRQLGVAENAPDDAKRRRHERIIKKATMDFFDGQLERTLDDAANNRR